MVVLPRPNLMLLTDGLPNCNAGFPTPYPDPGCVCTLSDCTYANRIGCLDVGPDE